MTITVKTDYFINYTFSRRVAKMSVKLSDPAGVNINGTDNKLWYFIDELKGDTNIVVAIDANEITKKIGNILPIDWMLVAKHCYNHLLLHASLLQFVVISGGHGANVRAKLEGDEWKVEIM